MLKIWGLQVKGLQNYQPSNFENDLTQDQLESRPIGSSGAWAGRQTFFLKPSALKAGNFEALYPIFTVLKDLNCLKRVYQKSRG